MFSEIVNGLSTHWPQIAVGALVLSVFVCVIAYIHNPRIKTLVFSMPVPFTCAYLSSGRHIDSTNITGLVLVVLYHWIVWTIYRHWKKPLGWGIAAGVIVYIAIAAALAKPMQAVYYPVAAGVALVMWMVAVKLYHPIDEPGHRSTAPWWIKGPIVYVIACVIFSLTTLLAGAVMSFPYAGVFTSYEMRHSPRTLAGQYTINSITFLMVFTMMWLFEKKLGQGSIIALSISWVALVTVLGLIYHFGVGRPKGSTQETEPVPMGD